MVAPSFVVIVGMESPGAQGPHRRAADRLDCSDPPTLACPDDAQRPSKPWSDWSRDFDRVRGTRLARTISSCFGTDKFPSGKRVFAMSSTQKVAIVTGAS